MASSSSSSTPCQDPDLVTLDEFFAFHHIDRRLFVRLAFALQHEPSEAMQVAAFWLWLERVNCRASFIQRILSFPDDLVEAVFEETMLCLRAAEMDEFNAVEDPHEIPMIQSILGTDRVRLRFFFENRISVLSGVGNIIQQVCLRAFQDLMRLLVAVTPSGGAFHNFYYNQYVAKPPPPPKGGGGGASSSGGGNDGGGGDTDFYGGGGGGGGGGDGGFNHGGGAGGVGGAGFNAGGVGGGVGRFNGGGGGGDAGFYAGGGDAVFYGGGGVAGFNSSRGSGGVAGYNTGGGGSGGGAGYNTGSGGGVAGYNTGGGAGFNATSGGVAGFNAGGGGGHGGVGFNATGGGGARFNVVGGSSGAGYNASGVGGADYNASGVGGGGIVGGSGSNIPQPPSPPSLPPPPQPQVPYYDPTYGQGHMYHHHPTLKVGDFSLPLNNYGGLRRDLTQGASSTSGANAGASSSNIPPYFPRPRIPNYDPSLERDLTEILGRLNLIEGSLNVDVPPSERTIFLTFSKGYPISEIELRDFLTRSFGDIIEGLYMHEVPENEQPLYARLVVRDLSSMIVVLGRQTKAKFAINGKHVWARKYISKNNPNSNSPPRSPPSNP